MSELVDFLKKKYGEKEDRIEHHYREGVELDKGYVLTEDYLKSIEPQLRQQMEFYTAYPDLFLDQIKPIDDGFSLFFFQRIFLRAFMRFKEVYITAGRATSKSFTTVLGLQLQCIFFPGTKRFICTPFKQQGAQVGREKLIEIFQHFPLLRKEIIGGDVSDTPGNYGKDYITLRYKNGSVFDLVGASDSTRGGRRQGGLIDEVRDHEEAPLNEIVLPLMNVSRRLPDNTVNPKEPNQQAIFCTSSGDKLSFAYLKLIDIFENSIINPRDAFCMGLDYRVPQMHGLIDKSYVDKLKMSPAYNPKTFAAEYLSLWEGANVDSWFNFDNLQKYRKIKNPEWHQKLRKDCEQFYLLAVDVGRLSCATVVTVFKVNIVNGKYYSSVVNVIVLGRTDETKTFHQQAIDIKKLIRDFDPVEVVIDINGLGIGLGDEMIRTQYDEFGNELEPLGFFNDDNYKKIQPRTARQILYGMKANGPLNSKIHGNAYARISSGMVRFLIKEQEAKSALLATKAGQKMDIEQRIKRLMPHEMTTSLFLEMANLRLKKTGNSGDIVLEQINSRFQKDKFSSLEYGLWRIKEREEEAYKRKKRGGSGTKRKLVFTKAGGR